GALSELPSVALGNYTNPGQLDSGDVDGDSEPEIVVAEGGQFNYGRAAAVVVLQPNNDGTDIVQSQLYSQGSVESASLSAGSAWAVVAQLGDVGVSGHQVDAVADTHVSTETADFARHVACDDCHNVHEATSTVAAAPAAYGSIKGTWGVSVDNAPVGEITYTRLPGVENEYELCFKCHGEWATSGESRDIASEFDTRKASVHAVEASSTASEATPDSFVASDTSWSNDSILYCADCHGTSNSTGAQGPHTSPDAPLLLKPYLSTSSTDESGLCYSCHKYGVYYTGGLDGLASSTSRFYDSNAATPALHSRHTKDLKLSCAACHTSHGSSKEHLIRTDVGYTHSGDGGSCESGCHNGDSLSYSRP
ncbi:MAG TPA: hypothetical protein VLA05_01560, partial [Coriobacteriia bacterium]|nr:hypothetical protein [Coriobacteriia bacterium]